MARGLIEGSLSLVGIWFAMHLFCAKARLYQRADLILVREAIEWLGTQAWRVLCGVWRQEQGLSWLVSEARWIFIEFVRGVSIRRRELNGTIRRLYARA